MARFVRTLSTTPSSTRISNYCRDQLKKHDYDRYLSSLFISSDHREHVWALGAFNIELATIKDTVSDSNLGKMRFAWWRDSIDRMFDGKVPEHPVAQGLALAIEQRSISKSWLKRLISERVIFYTDLVIN